MNPPFANLKLLNFILMKWCQVPRNRHTTQTMSDRGDVRLMAMALPKFGCKKQVFQLYMHYMLENYSNIFRLFYHQHTCWDGRYQIIELYCTLFRGVNVQTGSHEHQEERIKTEKSDVAVTFLKRIMLSLETSNLE